METIKFLDNADELHEIRITEQHENDAAPYRIELDGAFYSTAEHYTNTNDEASDILRTYHARIIND